MAGPSTSDAGQPAGRNRRGRRGRPNKNALRRAVFFWLGWIFVLLGIAGLFLPFLQGILFLVIGIFLVTRNSARARLLLFRVRERYPEAAAHYDSWSERARAWLKQRFKRGG
ncbi:MAG: hypothetical protein QNJ94_00645 [Alphaproteobacteria bacterium]|nr:hypothetical protein [Alphaproteobacteria bacterium]